MFRVLSTKINPSKISSIYNGCAKIYRVYKNPNAKDLFLKAQKAETAEEKAMLLEKMGDYNVVTEKNERHSKNRLMQFLKGLFGSLE